MSKLGAVVVGVGKLGTFHAQKYQKLKSEGVELVALVDPEAEKVKKIFSNVPVFLSIEELLQAKIQGEISTFNLASIASPTINHFQLGEALLEQGVHILVEKPLTYTVEEGKKLIELAKKKKLIIAVGQIERHRAATALQNLNAPNFIECHRLSPFPARSTDIDVVLDLMIHDIDLMLSIVKSPIKSLSAAGFPVLTDRADIANARFEFEDGCVANLTSSRISMSTTRKFRVFAKDTYVSLDLAAGDYASYMRNASEPDLTKAIKREEGQMNVQDALLEEVRDFVDAVKNNRPPLVQGTDGLHAQEVAEKVANSIDSWVKRDIRFVQSPN